MTIDIIIVVFLLLLGVALLLAEVFLLPGITIAGFAGGLSLIGGIIYSFMYLGNTAGVISIGASTVIGVGAFVYLIKSNAMNRIALETDIDAKVDQSDLKQLQVGGRGKTLSRLNPIGKAEFDGVTVEAKSYNGEFIDNDIEVEIIKIDSSNVLVQQIS